MLMVRHNSECSSILIDQGNHTYVIICIDMFNYAYIDISINMA